MTLLATAIFLIAPVNPNIQGRHEDVQQTHVVQPLAAERVPLSIWDSAKGNVVHLQSSMECAERVGVFGRTDLKTFDNFGLDVGCGYSTETAVVSVFFNRRGATSVSDDFEGAKNAILLRHPAAKPIAAGANQPAGLTFTSAAYESAPGIREGLWVADVSGWTLTFRATYEQAHEKDVADMISAMAAKSAATAGLHLAACAGTPPAVRKGVEIKDKERLMTLSLIASTSVAVETDKDHMPASENWCAESPAGDDRIPMLYWRNIAMIGNAGRADRLSLMTMESPPFLLVSGNPVATLVDAQSIKDGTTIYELTMEDGNVLGAYGFFVERPDLSVVNPIGKDVFTGRRAPLTTFNTGTNTITISGP